MDIMLDLETLGKKPGAVVLSIGAIVFNMYGPPSLPAPPITFYRNIDLFSSLMVGLKIDESTVDWWRTKDPQAQAALLKGAVTPAQAVADFHSWHVGLNPTTSEELQPRIWAKSPTFDCALWEAVCASVGKEVPWDFRAPRDVRTLFALAGFDEKSMTSKGMGFTQHNALDDCSLQILQVQEAWRKLKGVLIQAPSTPPVQVPSFAPPGIISTQD